MPTDYSPSQRPRRGGRRRGRRQSDGPARQTPSRKKPENKTLWQKIASFFSPEPSTANGRSGSSPVRVKVQTSQRQAPERPRPARKPEQVEVTSPRLYVGNLSFDATEGDLFELFNGVGNVQNVEIVSNRHTQRSKGFAFVQMQTIEEARRAVTELHDKDYMGRKLVVSGAKALEERRPERAEEPDEAPVREP